MLSARTLTAAAAAAVDLIHFLFLGIFCFCCSYTGAHTDSGRLSVGAAEYVSEARVCCSECAQKFFKLCLL